MSQIGFIGLGIMGTPMAGHLIKAGHELYLFSIPSVPQALVDAGGRSCTNGKEVAQKAEIIILMVPDTPNVRSALFDSNGIAEGLTPGKIVVDMSSISPIETKEFARRVNDLGCQYLDAPVSGGEVGAKNATLSIMVGGSETCRESPDFALACRTGFVDEIELDEPVLIERGNIRALTLVLPRATGAGARIVATGGVFDLGGLECTILSLATKTP